MAIKLAPIEKKTVSLWIKGISPLIQNAWSEKGLTMMRQTAAERRKQPKKARDPEGDVRSATHYTENGDYGIPAGALKASIINAAHKDVGLEKTLVRKSLFVICDDPGNIIPMQCDEPVGREDIVKVGNNQTDLRYRPEFKNWKANVHLELNAEALNEEDVVNLINRAGFGVGLLEWRPQKGGDYGRFEVDTSEPVEVN